MNTFQYSRQLRALLLLLSISFSAAHLLRLNEHNHHSLDESSSSLSSAATTNVEGPSPNANGIDDEQSQQSLIEQQFTSDPHSHRNHIQMIQHGQLQLVSIRYSPTSFTIDGNDSQYSYYNSDTVYGEFCDYNAMLNKHNPAVYSTAHALMGTSEHCNEHRYMIPLRDAMDAIQAYDDAHSSTSQDNTKSLSRSGNSGGTSSSSSETVVKTLSLSGFIFHEGYSGAGLLTNILAKTFHNTHVVSEHPALRDALSACDDIYNRYRSEDCSSVKHVQLVRDVITLLSRVSVPSSPVSSSDTTLSKLPIPEQLYIKLSSSSTAYLSQLHDMYPTTPWIFVHRQSDHVLSKHMSMKQRITSCIRNRRNPSLVLRTKSKQVLQDSSMSTSSSLDGLSNHEICALHLSTLVDVALSLHETTGSGMILSYDDDIINDNSSSYIVNDVLPYLGLQESMESLGGVHVVEESVSSILSMRSNVVGSRGRVSRDEDNIWDGEERIDVSNEVRVASNVYMRS